MGKTTQGEDLPVFVRWVEFVKWLLPTTEKFPKRARFAFINRIDNLVLSRLSSCAGSRRTNSPLLLRPVGPKGFEGGSGITWPF